MSDADSNVVPGRPAALGTVALPGETSDLPSLARSGASSLPGEPSGGLEGEAPIRLRRPERWG
jgi:hypothetical protein